MRICLDIELSTIQEAVPALTEYTTAQLRRAIKYDAKDTLEVQTRTRKEKRKSPCPLFVDHPITHSSMVSSIPSSLPSHLV